MRSWKKWILVIIIVGLLVAAGGYVLNNRAGTDVAATSLTEEFPVQRGDITARISPIGEVFPEKSASLNFAVSLAPLTELNVVAGQMVSAGEVLGRIDPTSLQRAVDQAETDLLSAEEELEKARQQYSELDIQRLKIAVSQAELSLEQARQAKDELLKPGVDKARRSVSDAEYDLQIARLNLEMTKIGTNVSKSIRDLEYALAWYERLERDMDGGYMPPARRGQEPMTLEEARSGRGEAWEQLELARLNASLTLSNAEARVSQAEKALSTARQDLEQALAGPDALALAQAENAITQAELRLAKARDDVQTALEGGDETALELAQARYDAAKAALADAQAALQGAVMVAPFDGTIISLQAKEGDEVSSNRAILTMADLTRLRVRAFIDETQISQVREGQVAQITFDAFPGQAFRGEVLEVPVEGALSQNVVTFEVVISLENLVGAALKPGMTANINLVTGQGHDVLLVPAFAIQQTTEGPAVMVRDATGSNVLTGVETGLTDGTYVQIVRGLIEGDVLIAQYALSQAQTMFPGGGVGEGSGIFGSTFRALR